MRRLSINMRLITKFGDITIEKGHSYYWRVNGRVPLAVAEKLYNHSFGRSHVRVAGHCMCPPPSDWTTWFDENGVELVPRKELTQYLNDDGSRKDPSSFIWQAFDDPKYKWVDEPSKEGQGFVTSYHIDTAEGLLFFVVTIMNEMNAKMVF